MLHDVNIRNIGKLTDVPEDFAEGMVGFIRAGLDDYSDSAAVYRVGELEIVFPMETAPDCFLNCDWALATDSNTGEPYALIADIDPYLMGQFRCYLRGNNPFPVVIHCHAECAIFYNEPEYADGIGAWFPMIIKGVD